MNLAKSENPFVSVLMTAYNREKYISEAIESVLKSSYTNFELIIIDDSSKDKTFEIAFSYFKKDDRIKIFKNECNIGQFANRNKAIHLAKGEYVKFLDSDDKLLPNSLKIMVESMTAYPGSGIGVPALQNSFEELPYQLTPYESVSQHYTEKNHLNCGPTGTIFKKNALICAGLFEPAYGILADTLLNLKVASLYPTVIFEQNLTFWRTHNEQVTVEQKDRVRMIKERDVIMKASLKFSLSPLSEAEKKLILNNFIKINTRHFLYFLLHGKIRDAFKIKRQTDLTPKKVCISFLKSFKF